MEGAVVGSLSVGESSNAGAAETLCPLYFGASCSFMALHLLSKSSGPDLDSARRCRLGEALLQGSARLLGLLVWRLQNGRAVMEERAATAEKEVRELKRLRAEDAKANEKVAGIVATRERCWIAEKRSLRRETRALMSSFRILEAQKEEAMAEANSRIVENERTIRAKEEALEEETGKRTELEEKLRAAEAAAEETRERARKEAHEHATELRNHRTAFAELVSNHRQLEAEMGRALRQVEVSRLELDEALEQKEDAIAMVEKLSDDIARMRRDGEQKGKVLSALLRKSKLDVAEKQTLLKEVRAAKSREKEAELELGKLRNLCGMQRRRNGPHVPQLSDTGNYHDGQGDSPAGGGGFHHHRVLLVDYLQSEGTKRSAHATPERCSTITGGDSLDQCSTKDSVEELDMKELQDWVHLEIEKCTNILQRRHYAEVEAFTEQMRLKDEKLDAFRWRVLSMDLESKRLHARVETLEGDLSRYREECMKLEALLLEKEHELKVLKEELVAQARNCPTSSPSRARIRAFDSPALWSEMSSVECDTAERRREPEAGSGQSLVPVVDRVTQGNGDWNAKGGAEQPSSDFKGGAEQALLEPRHVQDCGGWVEPEPAIATFVTPASCEDQLEIHTPKCINNCKGGECRPEHPEQGTAISQASAGSAEEEEKEVSVDLVHLQLQKRTEVSEVINKAEAVGQPSTGSRDPPWKVDLHAMGISYKIKRLKQQLLVLEKLAEVQEPGEEAPVEDEQKSQTLVEVISLVEKQVKKYESLQEKADELCKKMEKERGHRSPSVGRSKEQAGALGSYLEEAFQLQRHIVATGQKLPGVQSRLAHSAVKEAGGHPAGFDAGQFAKVAKTLFREIQRGFEVRVARMIGSLEGTLARDGILHIGI